MERDTILIIIAIIIFILFTIGLLSYLRNEIKIKQARRLWARERMINSLEQSFYLNNINTCKDFIDIIEGFPEVEKLRLNLPWELKLISQQLKYQINKSAKSNNSDMRAKLNAVLVEIEKYVEEEKIKDPFENVPAIERNLLIDILEISNQKGNIVFSDKLNKLAEHIIIRQQTIDKLGSDNEESLRKSKQSIILAIVFFIISTAFTIYSLLK